MSRYCIVGGGLSGLSAAFHLRNKYPTSIITVIEGSARFGGWVETEITPNQTRFEVGPRSVRVASPTAPHLFHLCEKLDLSANLIPISKNAPAAQKRFVFAHGELHELKPPLLKPSSLFKKPLLPTIISSLLNDRRLSQIQETQELSVDEYFRMHFNDEIADIAINPMIRGIFAGDSKQLGVRSVFPHVVRTEVENNGLLRGLIKESLSFNKEKPCVQSSLYNRAVKENWSVYGIKGGLGNLISTLVNRLKELNIELISDSDCVDLECTNSREMSCLYETSETQKSLKCDHVFLAVPSPVCIKLLKNVSTQPFESLLDMPFVDVAVVGLKYSDAALPVNGFGHLIPSWEIPHVLGVVYDSCLFPDANSGTGMSTKLTCMIGGAWFEEYCRGMAEEDFLKLAIESVRSQLGIKSLPSDHFVRISRQCIPQYPIGLQENVSKARSLIKDENLPISLIGSSFDGVSVNDCVASAYRAVSEL